MRGGHGRSWSSMGAHRRGEGEEGQWGGLGGAARGCPWRGELGPCAAVPSVL
jgi:hypothetical protein